MIFTIVLFALGLIALIWSANLFIDGAASIAKFYKVSPLLIGILIVGFGTSAPELLVSAISAYQGSPGLAMGNAYGSNIANIALILGISAIVHPITVHSKILRKELPVLLLLSIIAGLQILDGNLSRMNALFLLIMFALLIVWTLKQTFKESNDALGQNVSTDCCIPSLNIKKAWIWLIAGLTILIASSRLLVATATSIATFFGVSELVIGLTIIALGTSLPELASCLCAIRKGEYDLALGNVLGSNLFNTLAVVGIAGIIHPFSVETIVIRRDILLMIVLTLLLFIFGYGITGKQGKINRLEGILLCCIYIGYLTALVLSVLS